MTLNMTSPEFFALPADAISAEKEADFIGKLKMRNGTFKLTKPDRFSDVESAIGPAIKARSATIKSVLDIGVSTGITSLEFLDYLKAQGLEAKLTATDLYIDAHIVSPAPGLKVLADSHGWPLEYVLFGKSLRPWTMRRDYLTLSFLPRAIGRSILPKRIRAMISNGQTTPVTLINSGIAKRSEITFVENNILQQSQLLVGQFDLIRAANILNLGYFSNQQILNALNNIRSYLRGPGALFLVTRTNSAGENNCTLFELGHDQSFKVILRIGAGSEIEASVLSLQQWR